jgi:p-aminobenzoyl-glutamate transporter AbgT
VLIFVSLCFRIIILSLVSSAGHFAFKLDQSMRELFVSTLTDARNLVILLGRA